MTEKQYKYFIFDWDGTLVDTLEIWFSAYQKTFLTYGAGVTYDEIAQKAYGDTYGCHKFGIENHEAFNSDLINLVRHSYHRAALYPDAQKILNLIHKNKYKLAIASSTPRELLLKGLEFHKLESLIDLVIGREDVKEVKPDPQAIKIALSRGYGNKKTTLLIGDSEKDILAGQRCDIDTALFAPKQNFQYGHVKIRKQLVPTHTLESMAEMIYIINSNTYKSTFVASPTAEGVLRKGRIIDDHESSADMTNRMLNELFDIESSAFKTPPTLIASLKREFGLFLDRKDCVMSTPIMTNAGRHADKPLSAVTVPPISLRSNRSQIKELIDSYHQHAIGTGFNLDETDDPAETLSFINSVAVQGADSGKEDRPVGNMAILSVHHPRILEFVSAKVGSHARGEKWKFNISVDASPEYMKAVKSGTTYALSDGTQLNAREVLKKIVEAAHESADPGLAFLHRMNRENPTPAVGKYISTAPCADVGLAPGESCQFGYINLGNFVQNERQIDLEKLKRLVRLMTRVLDNSLELSLERYAHQKNTSVMRAKRKVGIGICGVADLLVKLQIPYDSRKGRELIRDLIAYINFESKMASHELAYERNSFEAMHSAEGNKYLEVPGFIENKYGSIRTAFITPEMWIELGQRLRRTKKLRNASTIAIPPTGRSSLVIDASTGIEPMFSLVDYDGDVNYQLQSDLKTLYNQKRITKKQLEHIKSTINKTGTISQLVYLPKKMRSVYKTALDIAPIDHLLMIAAIQPVVDEAVSKTINMPSTATTKDVMDAYLKAYALGLKGVTVYREGIAKNQPRKLSKL